jgi:hypothetical protein
VADDLSSVQKKHLNDVFVESGATATGSAISSAWQAGYKKIYMIDANSVLVKHAEYLFTTYFDMAPTWRPVAFADWKPELHFVLGNSVSDLGNIIKNVHVPITFFLHSYRASPDEVDATNNILMELEQIRQHHVKTHVILIDNIDLAGTPLFGNVTLNEVLVWLQSINPNYVFTFSDGGHLGKRSNALLTAFVPSTMEPQGRVIGRANRVVTAIKRKGKKCLSYFIRVLGGTPKSGKGT